MIEDKARELAQGKNFATFTTLLPSGYPMTHVMWVDADEEHVWINTEIHRTKFKNVERDPRVSVTVIDQTNPYMFAEVRGEVVEVIRGQEARDHIDKLAQKYQGQDYPAGQIQSERVILKIAPRRQKTRG
jgi:PPOX class probable F420-dependent enzyme